jgi:hypothetical protein
VQGCISNVLWKPFLFPRWCLCQLLCLDQFYLWEYKFSLNYKSKYKNKSLGLSLLENIFEAHFKIKWGHYKICVSKGCGTCEMTMCISYHLAYYKVARSIPNPRFDECIWVCVPTILLQLKNLKVRFATHFTILKATFWQPKNIVLNKVWVPRMFSPLPLTFKFFCLSLFYEKWC